MGNNLEIKPLSLYKSILLFCIPSAFFCFVTYIVVPYFNKVIGIHPALSWFYGGYFIFTPLFGLALVLYRLENRKMKISLILQRFRIKKLSKTDLKWYGVFSNQGQGKYDFNSLHGETITIYGKGLYQYDSVSMASQAIAQDIVTMILGIPLLIISLYFSRKGSLKGRLLIMLNILKKQNGMSIVGQGGKIILFMLPSLITAILIHTNSPQIAGLPESISFIKPVGYLLLLLGLILWGAAVGPAARWS